MENQEAITQHNPMDYLKVFFRRKWLFIAPTFFGLVFGIMASFLLPPGYESSTTILVEEEKIINPLIQNLAISTTAAQRMQTIKEIIMGWSSLVELSRKLDLAKDVQNQMQFERLILNLRKNIEVEMPGPNVIKISYASKDAQLTHLVTKTLSDILIEKNMQSQTKETDVAINFIKEQLAIYKRKIKESEVAHLEDQLKKLLMDSTEMHPLVKELRQKISIAKKELDSGEYQVSTAEQPLNDATRLALKKELDNLINKETQSLSGSSAFAGEPSVDPNTSIYKLILMDKVNSSIARDMSVNENIYNMLLQRLETAKITQRLEASKEGTRYNIVEPARLPLRPTKPNKLMVIFIGLCAGGAAGTGLVLGREFMDKSFLDVEDARHTLALPVLGAISRITTQEEINRERAKKEVLIVVALIAAGVLIVASMLISLLLKR